MMGGDGKIEEGELNEMHLSAISEAMNQMIGSAATSLSSMLNKRINISPPTAFIIRFENTEAYEDFADEAIVKIAFKMVVGNLIDSEIMQLMPMSFAKTLIQGVFENSMKTVKETQQYQVKKEQPKQNVEQKDDTGHFIMNNMRPDREEASGNLNYQQEKIPQETIKVQPVQFKSFEEENAVAEKQKVENIDIVMDIPLEVTVELGRTRKIIKDILNFNNGTVIELDKLAGDPVDIYVNEKKIAKGEVVIIDDSFGVRITDIVHPSKV